MRYHTLTRLLLLSIATTAIAACQATDTAPAPLALSPAASADLEPALALATFDEVWSVIERTHFDPTYNGVDWHAVREELRPHAHQAHTQDELRAVLHEMLSRLGQSHFTILPAEATRAMEVDDDDDAEASDDTSESTSPRRRPSRSDRPGSIGADLRLIDNEILITSVEPDSPAHHAGLKPGMKLLGVGTREVSRLIQLLPDELDPRTRQLHAWHMVTARLAGDPGTSVDLRLEDENGERTVSVSRDPETGNPIKFGHLPTFHTKLTHERVEYGQPPASIGIIAFNIWMVPLSAPFAAALDELRDAEGIVLDLRGNPGGVAGMSMGIAGHFLDERLSLGTMTTRDTELRIVTNPQRVNPSGQRVAPYSGPLAIVVDAQTGSTSEIFAAGLQALGRARVFGETTMGAALPAMMTRLPNGDTLMHAFANFVDPNGEAVEGRGVVPDENVRHTAESLRAGHDAPLEAALRWIASQR